MNNIANERKKLGITQSELAGSCGWNQSRLANYEAGIRAPDLDSCRRLIGGPNHERESNAFTCVSTEYRT